MPAFALHFGVMPWHIDGGQECLTFEEVDVFAEALDELRKQDEEAARRARGR